MGREAPTKNRPPLFSSQVCAQLQSAKNGKEGRLTLLVRLGRPEFYGPVGPWGIFLAEGSLRLPRVFDQDRFRILEHVLEPIHRC